MKTKVKKLRAVGFASYKPMLFVVFGMHSSNQRDPVFLFPPKRDGAEFSLPDPGDSRNYVLVTAPERLRELKPWSSKIHRAMVFAKPEELVALGVPILDVDLQDGKIVRILEHSPEDMRQRIEAEAKLLSFKAMARPTKKKATKAKAKPKEETPIPKPKEAAPAEVDPEEGDPEFISRLKGIRDQFTGTKVEFEDLVLLPAIFRMVRQISKAEFQKALRVVSRKGVPKKDIKKFRLFLETKGEVGYRLGQALRAYVSADTKPKISKLAKQYDQSLLDIKLAIIGLRKFHAR